ncbi:hypothetical protein Pr1d_02800 [Bythopirellula goksoeyrii]|uniref:VWFA domain-containing protein n=1 Tax=Bythopirellula goksoeyrii TaxID=1400387 RepID=A0A5B9Q5R3_9BACT|nr:hypothetical protein Pr1d_02800 [Bythopirellula goksoeyrii]
MVPNSAQKDSHSIQRRLRPRADISQSGQAVSEEDLESFRFDVTAGKKLRIDGGSYSKNGSHPCTAQPQQVGPQVFSNILEEPQATASVPRIQIAAKRSSQQGRKKFPSWAASLFLHVLFILFLAYFTFSAFDPQVDFTLSLESEAFVEEDVELQEIEFDPLEEIESDVNQLASEIQEASQISASELSAEVALADMSNLSGSENLGLGELSGLFGARGNALSEMLPAKEKLTATFFETKVEGRRIVYVVDNSGGMRSGELETLIDELMKSVESLSDKQEFYVIFYSDSLYPLFYPDPVQRFVPANDRFKEQLRRWLDTVEFCQGNVVDNAIEAATLIRPDVVYLLTDGDLDQTRDQRRLTFLLNPQGRRFPIHTFGMGTGEKGRAAEKLQQVAEANYGKFRAVKISAAAKNAALRKKRPYHDKEPGDIWGRNVGSSWGKR